MGRRIVSVIAVLTAFSSTPALATGPIAPPPPSIVPVVPPMPPVYDWSGAYAGAAVGYSNMTVEDLSFGPGQFSPDGGSVVYSLSIDGKTDLFLLNLGSGQRWQLTQTNAIDTARFVAGAPRVAAASAIVVASSASVASTSARTSMRSS